MENNTRHIDTYLATADSLRFKLWVIVGKNIPKQNNIIEYLKDKGYVLVDVGKELAEFNQVLDANEEVPHDVGLKVKEWFLSKPEKLILVNASILYHETFKKLSPIGAFKYNSRHKNSVLFLEDEKLMGGHVYHGEHGSKTYYDKNDTELLKTKIDDIEENYQSISVEQESRYNKNDELPLNAIGRLFNYTSIKDVVDIDTDLKHQNLQKELVESYVISKGLEDQIIEFLDNLQSPNHKAAKIVGNYGSGKSHLIAFLVSIINNKKLVELIKNAKVRTAAQNITRQFFTVQFELQPINIDLSDFFFKELEKQMLYTYGISIPKFTTEVTNFKDHLAAILETLKINDPSKGLLVIIDEVSDFIESKESYRIKRDFQFLRIVAQVCQDQDMVIVTSMQEDIYTSVRLQAVAADEDRISQRFQNIIIRREAVKQVIAQRIVPKTKEQKLEIEEKLKPFIDKIEDVANKKEEYIELFPFTPSLLNIFHELPYFEKRGIIQFAQKELKLVIHKPFPCFFTFDRIFDILANNPNNRNLDRVYDLVKVVRLIEPKLLANLTPNLYVDALKLVKGLAVYALWSHGNNGATAKELAEQLLIIPQNNALDAHVQVALIIKKVREITDGYYLKVVKDAANGNDYFKLDPSIDGKPIDERIEDETNAIGGDEDKQESVLFDQIKTILTLTTYKNLPDVFEDEAVWASVNSFRRGLIVFQRKGQSIDKLDAVDYVINFISPFCNTEPSVFCKNQLDINLKIGDEANIVFIKNMVAIQSLIAKKIRVPEMTKKLTECIEGNPNKNPPVLGIKHRIAKWVFHISDVRQNGKSISVKLLLGKEFNNLTEIMDALKEKTFDAYFNNEFPEHPKYAQKLTSANITASLTNFVNDLADGNFNNLKQQTQSFLNSLRLLNTSGNLDITDNKIAQTIRTIVNAQSGKMVNIEKELVAYFAQKPYGLEAPIVHFYLLLLTLLGKIALKGKGGDEIDITNIKEKFKNLSQFDNLLYAVKKDDLSYDFACHLLNALNLNGAIMLRENTRNEGFLNYKNKLVEIRNQIKGLEAMLDKLEKQIPLFIQLDHAKKLAATITYINWASLDINNHAKFNTIAHLNSQLPDISTALANLTKLTFALQDYNRFIHQGIGYMNDALTLIDNNTHYLPDATVATRLKQFYNDTIAIAKNFERYLQTEERRPLEGKINAFKDLYIKGFYYPALQNTIGDKVNWTPYETFTRHPLFEKIMLLSQLDCNLQNKIDTPIKHWNNLLQLRQKNVDIDRLYQIPFDTNSNFMKVERDYAAIKQHANQINETLKNIYEDYAQTTIAEISKKNEQLPLINIADNHKTTIANIINTQKLPDTLTQGLIVAINKLFVDITIVTIKKDELLNALFKKDELTTMPQLHEAFFNFYQQLQQQHKGQEVRLRID